MTERILVVEDDPVLARVLRDLLTVEAYDVRCVHDGNLAVKAAAEFLPDLVLLDINLPGRSGFDLCKLWSHQGISVIVTTARGGKTDRLTGLELGADDYVTKPFDLEELLARIRAVLRRTLQERAQLRSTSPARAARPGVERPSPSRSADARSAIRLLCVDPQPVALEGIMSLIAKQPDMHVVATAGSGEQAIELFDQHRPDITVLELELPTMSGFDLIRAIRGRDQQARMVVLSAYRGDEDIFTALQAGAATYVLKDSLTTELVSFIRHVHAGRTSLPGRVQAILANRARTTPLTNREVQVLRHAAMGMQNREIAEALDITPETVKVHIKNVLSKLGARDRAEAFALAARRGIIHIS
jgi:DNA-binding NarL/FixJ family response regulator